MIVTTSHCDWKSKQYAKQMPYQYYDTKCPLKNQLVALGFKNNISFSSVGNARLTFQRLWVPTPTPQINK